MNIFQLIPSSILIAVVSIAAVWDLRFNKIPNWLTFSAAATAIGYHTSMNALGGFLFSLEGIGLGVAVLLPFYLAGGMGAGDVKLLGAIGGLLGPQGVFTAFLFTAFVGGVYALVFLALRGYMKEMIGRYWLILKIFILTRSFIYIPDPEGGTKPRLLYGLAIGLGTLLSVGWNSHIFMHISQ